MYSKTINRLLARTTGPFSDEIKLWVTRLFSRRLRKQIIGEVMDKFAELLLGGMDLAFFMFKDYRKNILGFKGRYVFASSDERIAASAIFENDDMHVRKEAISDWDVRVTFKDVTAFRDFIFSKDHDILNALLENKVEVDGNLNYLYKFGFMANDLVRRLGVI